MSPCWGTKMVMGAPQGLPWASTACAAIHPALRSTPNVDRLRNTPRSGTGVGAMAHDASRYHAPRPCFASGSNRKP